MSDFDDFMKESDGTEAEQEHEDEIELSLLKQIKESIRYSGSDTDDEILMLVCEEFRDVCTREAATLQKQIDEIKDRKRTRVEKQAKEDDSKALVVNGSDAYGQGSEELTGASEEEIVKAIEGSEK